MKRVIFQQDNFRIIEVDDELYDLDDLKGDQFKPEYNPDLSKTELRHSELLFESQVDSDGVFGYVLEQWNPEINQGWTSIHSCWGFVGSYDEQNNKHCFVDELKDYIFKNDHSEMLTKFESFLKGI